MDCDVEASAGEVVRLASTPGEGRLPLADGRSLRLSGLDIETVRVPELSGTDAILLADAGLDRHGDLRGDLVVEGESLAERLVAAGAARVRPAPPDRACYATLLALEASAQGAAFLKALIAGWPEISAAAPLRQWKRPVYAVAFGAAAAVAGIEPRPAIVAYLQAFCSNLVSAALRLMPIGQSDGLACLAQLSKTLPSLADALELVPFDDIGAAALMVDVFSMRHETQYTRLFRS